MSYTRIKNNIYLYIADVTPPYVETAELFISLKPLASTIEAQVIGLGADNVQATYIKKDINSQITGSLRVYETSGVYYADYDMNGTYKTAQTFTVDTELELDLFSADRLDASDLSGLTLTIDNETSMTLYINRISEDYSDPRFIAIISSGTVVFR